MLTAMNRKGDRFIFTRLLLCRIGSGCTRQSDGEFELIKINLSPFLIIAGLVFCGACSTVQQAPVEERQEADIDTNGAARTDEPVTPAPEDARRERAMDGAHHKSAGSGFGRPEDARRERAMDGAHQTGDDFTGTWTELPEPGEPPPPGQVETEALAEPGRLSENPAVIALLDDTDLRISQGDAEGAVSSVERALRLEPRNPWLWHRLAVLRLRQGQWRQAIALAEKSNSLSVRHPEIRKANAELIEQAEKR